MKAPTMLDTIRSMLGVPACAIPLSICKPAKSYLLEKVGLSSEGTAILFAIPYVITADVDAPDRNISLYAVPKDYHGYIKELESSMLPSLHDLYPEHTFSFFADHSPILEVDAAARAGLGVLGMNGLLITPDFGSFVFIGELLTSADYVTVTGALLPSFPEHPPLCEGCGACLDACPSGCHFDTRDGCLSSLTQKKGDLTHDEMMAIREGGLVWGCDRCQIVCPHNRQLIRNRVDTPIPYFREDRLIHLDSDVFDAMNDEDFSHRAYSWRGRSVVRRNIEILTLTNERRKT